MHAPCNITPSDVGTPLTSPSPGDVDIPLTSSSPGDVNTPLTSHSEVDTPLQLDEDDSGLYGHSSFSQEEPLDDSPYHQNANMFDIMGEKLEESSSAKGESLHTLIMIIYFNSHRLLSFDSVLNCFCCLHVCVCPLL